MLNTDIVYLDGSRGENRERIPDCFQSMSPPKKVGRNREKDQLLLQIHFQNGDVGKEEYSRCIKLASQYYYGTSGSITAASRASINAVNKRLLEKNRTGGFSPPVQAGITCAILRGDDLYVTQAGPGGVVVFRESNFEQFPDNNVSARAVGMSDQTIAHYFHTVISKGDLLWMNGDSSSDWDFTSFLRKKGDLNHYLFNLRILTSNDIPSMVCRFCDSGEQGQLNAVLSAIEHVDSVSSKDVVDYYDSGMDTRTDITKPSSWASDILSSIDDDAGDTIAHNNGSSTSKSDDLLESYAVSDAETDVVNGIESENMLDESNASSWASDILSSIDDDAGDTIAHNNGSSTSKSDDLLESYAVSDAETDVVNGIESENMLDESNASSWASDILSSIDEHETGGQNYHDKFLSESFEQPQSAIEYSDHLSNTEGDTHTIDSELDVENPDINRDIQQENNISDNVYVQSGDNGNYSAELVTTSDTELLDYSEDSNGSVFVDYDEDANQRQSHQTNNDFVDTLDVGSQSDWESPRKRHIDFSLSVLQTRLEANLKYIIRSWSVKTHKMVSRILPDYDHDVQVPGSALLWGAAGVPVLVVVLTIAVYVQFGRARQFNYYVDQARMEATLGRNSKDAIQAAPHWRQVLLWSSLAHEIRSNHPDVELLETAAIGFLDVIDRVERVDVELISLDGLQPNANISKILARGSSVYLLDLKNQSVNRAVLTTSGQYQLDPVFECRNGAIGGQSIETLVDIAWLDTPNVVGQDTLIALDPDGRLLYCTSDGTMAVTLLTPPYDGWNNPVALEAFQGRIYVMEPDANEVWVYTRDDKFFVQAPERYFSESAIDLSDAIDISIVQGSIYILHEDGHMTECIRKSQDLPPECNLEMTYIDGRLGRVNDTSFENVSFPVSMAAYPPPYSSLYLTDSKSPGVFQFSLRLAYQREFRAVSSNGEVEAIGFAVGPGRDLFFASKDSLYVGKRP